MDKQKEIEILKEYVFKMRVDGLNFIDDKYPDLSQLEKDVLLYSLFQNAKRGQLSVMKNLYGIEENDLEEIEESK